MLGAGQSGEHTTVSPSSLPARECGRGPTYGGQITSATAMDREVGITELLCLASDTLALDESSRAITRVSAPLYSANSSKVMPRFERFGLGTLESSNPKM